VEFTRTPWIVPWILKTIKKPVSQPATRHFAFASADSVRGGETRQSHDRLQKTRVCLQERKRLIFAFWCARYVSENLLKKLHAIALVVGVNDWIGKDFLGHAQTGVLLMDGERKRIHRNVEWWKPNWIGFEWRTIVRLDWSGKSPEKDWTMRRIGMSTKTCPAGMGQFTRYGTHTQNLFQSPCDLHTEQSWCCSDRTRRFGTFHCFKEVRFPVIYFFFGCQVKSEMKRWGEMKLSFREITWGEVIRDSKSRIVFGKLREVKSITISLCANQGIDI
jgi:hypothetical protein